jgi:hypothetical protein
MVPEDAEEVQAAARREYQAPIVAACSLHAKAKQRHRLASLKSGGAPFVPNRVGEKEVHYANGVVRASPFHLLKIALVAAYLLAGSLGPAREPLPPGPPLGLALVRELPGDCLSLIAPSGRLSAPSVTIDAKTSSCPLPAPTTRLATSSWRSNPST